jgi:2-dehydropantoate 2-reductase
MGAGGIGGYYGGMLARSGHEVTLIARGDHLAVIQKKGLIVKSTDGDFSVRVKATDDLNDVDAADFVLFSVKSYDVEEAGRLLHPVISSETVVLTIQNGIDSHEILAEILGKRPVLAGACYIFSRIASPGVIEHTGGRKTIVFGELDGSATVRSERIFKIITESGIPCEISPDIKKALWQKFIWICGSAGLGTLTRLPLGESLATVEGKALLRGIMEEVESIARALHIGVDQGIVDKTAKFAEGLEKELVTSLVLDLIRKRRLESDALHGKVVKLGRELGIPTPLNFAVYASLKSHDLKAMKR